MCSSGWAHLEQLGDSDKSLVAQWRFSGSKAKVEFETNVEAKVEEREAEREKRREKICQLKICTQSAGINRGRLCVKRQVRWQSKVERFCQRTFSLKAEQCAKFESCTRFNSSTSVQFSSVQFGLNSVHFCRTECAPAENGPTGQSSPPSARLH